MSFIRFVLLTVIAFLLLSIMVLVMETGALMDEFVRYMDEGTFLVDSEGGINPDGAARKIRSKVRQRKSRYMVIVLFLGAVGAIISLVFLLWHTRLRSQPALPSGRGDAAGPAEDYSGLVEEHRRRIFRHLEMESPEAEEESFLPPLDVSGAPAADEDNDFPPSAGGIGSVRRRIARIRELRGDDETPVPASSYDKMLEALQKVNDLEKKHTIELAEYNQRLEEEVLERNRAEKEIRRLSAQLINGIEKAQKQLARDLHDEFGQTLAALHMGLDSLEKGIPDYMVDQKEKITGLVPLIEQLGDRIRSISSDLRPDLLDDLGLIPTLNWYVSEFNENNHAQVQFQHIGFKKRIRSDQELILYRIFQESLNNVVKHSGADRVRVTLTFSYPKVMMTVQDNGAGFVKEKRSSGIGLIGMRERAVAVGGRLKIHSAPGKGTIVWVELPVSGPAEEDGGPGEDAGEE